MPTTEIITPALIKQQKTQQERDRLEKFGQPQGALVTSDLSNEDFLALKTDEASGLYVHKIVSGTPYLTIQADQAKAAELGIKFEARFFKDEKGLAFDGAEVKGVWQLVSHVDLTKLQTLSAQDSESLQVVVLNNDGHVFTQLGYNLQGLDETVSLIRVRNHVFEDPTGNESGHSTVLLELSNNGGVRPDLSSALITSEHGQISGFKYALEGKSDAEATAYLNNYQIHTTADKPLAVLRATLLEATYEGDQAALQVLTAMDTKVKESGFELENLDGYSLARNHAPVWLHGKSEVIVGPGDDRSGVFTANLLEGAGFNSDPSGATERISRQITTQSAFLDATGNPVTAAGHSYLLGASKVHSELLLQLVKSEALEDGRTTYTYVATQQTLGENMPNIIYKQVEQEQWVVKTEDGGQATFINQITGTVDNAEHQKTTVSETEDDLFEPVDISVEMLPHAGMQQDAPLPDPAVVFAAPGDPAAADGLAMVAEMTSHQKLDSYLGEAGV